MKFSLSTISLALAVTASAVPIEEEQHSERSTITGPGPGSIFQFGSASNCRTIFWNSGACGLSTFFPNQVSASMPLVALPSRIFEAHGSSDQDNPLCAKVITMKHNGVTRQAVISDENTSDEQSIDMCLDLWQAFGGHDGDGTLIENISWSIAA